MAQIVIEKAQEELDEEHQQKDNKHQYQINRSVAAGLIKDEIPKMLFGQEPADHFYERMVKLIVRHRQPVRPNRAYPRRRRHKLKFPMNLRRIF